MRAVAPKEQAEHRTSRLERSRVFHLLPVFATTPLHTDGWRATGPQPQGDFAWRAQRTGQPAADWRLLQRVSCANPEGFWSAVLRELGVRFAAPPTRILREAAPDDPDG
jgi:hypothetical protein